MRNTDADAVRCEAPKKDFGDLEGWLGCAAKAICWRFVSAEGPFYDHHEKPHRDVLVAPKLHPTILEISKCAKQANIRLS